MKPTKGRLRKKPLIVLVIVSTFIVAAIIPMATSSDEKRSTRSVADTLTAVYTETAPTMNGLATEVVWDDATELTISVASGTNPGDVKLKALYDGTNLYIYAEWDDPTLSIIRGAQGTNVELYSGAWEYNPPPADTLRSVKTGTPPTIDGNITDAVWDSAHPLTVSVSGGTNPGDITIKSLFNDTHIFVQAQWSDPTFSIIRGAQGVNPADYSGAWEWDENNVTAPWNHTIGGSEDRCTFFWNINATDFETEGCMVKCHPGSASYLDNEGEIADMWHMKAARFLGAIDSAQVGTPTIVDNEATAGEFHLDGYSDDKHVIYDPNLGASGDGGRHGDAGSGCEYHNRNITEDAPLYMEKDPDDWLDAMILHQSEIDAGEVIVADPDDTINYSAQNIASAWANYSALDAIVPERILKLPSGSRGNVRESGIWKDGVWTVEYERLLETGNDDDVQFDDLTASYDFGVATMDNTGGEGHNYHIGTPLHLDFQTAFIHVEGGSEDRLTFMWEIINITNFEEQGCMVKCHPAYGSAGSFLDTPGEKADMWHMKTARCLPVISANQVGTPTIGTDHQATAGKFEFHGYYDDKYMDYQDTATLTPDEGDGGRHGDAGSGCDSHNRNADKTAPLYMEKNPIDYIDAMVLLQSEIDAGEVYVVASTPIANLSEAHAIYVTLNAIIPERILDVPSGSRADIEQYAVWENGTWHTEIIRKLVTGNDDDVQFDDLDKTYQFGIATMDNCGGDGHNTHSNIYELAFEIPAPPPPTSYSVNVGPIKDEDGEVVSGATVAITYSGTSKTGTTGTDGDASIVVPADWAGNTVSVGVTKDGFDDLTFSGTISSEGEFSPAGGTYPQMAQPAEEEEGDATLLFIIIIIVVIVVVLLMVMMTKRGKKSPTMPSEPEEEKETV